MWRILFIFCFVSQALATTYYVRKDGSDSNAGTSDTSGGAFLTIQKGVNTAVSNDIVNVRVGNYQENVTSARGAYNGSKIIIDGGNVAQMWSFLSTHSNLVVQNFTFAGKASAWWFFMGKGAHFNIISNCIFDVEYNLNASTILRWDNPTPVTETPFGGNIASGCLVISNLFKRASGTTVVSVMGDTNLIYGNTLIDGDAVDWFHVWGRSNKVVGNICSNDFVSGASANHPDFFQAFGANGLGNIACLIESNIVIHMEGDCQIGIMEGQDCPDIGDYTFRNNVFIGISKPFMAAMRDVYFYNNTFYQCNTNEVGGSGGPVLIYTSAEWTGSVEAPPGIYTNYTNCTGIGGRVYNNVFYKCGSTNLDRGWYTFSSDLTNISADYNFVSKQNYLSVVTNLSHQRIGDAGGWQKFQWWEDHGINGGNPFFWSESFLDFRLARLSPAIGVATNLNGLFTTDFNGSTRGTLWDIGAFEYVDPLVYITTNPIACDLETKSLMGFALSSDLVNTIVWPTNQYGNVVLISRRNYTNDPNQWANWTSVYTNAVSPVPAGVYNDTNILAGTSYEYQLMVGNTNKVCGTNIDFGYYGVQYLYAGVRVPLRDQRGNVILLVEKGVTNSLATELATLVLDLRGDGYKVYRHDISAVDVSTNGSPGSWYTAVTNTKALILADYVTAPSNNWTLFIVGHVPIPYSGESSPGFHSDNVGAHPADWYYVDTNEVSWTDSTVNNITSDWIDARNVPSDGKFDQSQFPTMPEIRLGRIDLRNMPAFALTEVQLLSQYLNRDHQWRHKQFTVRDRALIGTNNDITVPPYEAYGVYSGLFGNGTNYDVGSWLIMATNTSKSYLMASSHGNASYEHDNLLGYTTNFAAGSLYSVFNSMYGSYYGDWDSSQHSNDVMMAPLCTTGYTLGLFYREQQIVMNPSSIGEPYSDDLWFAAGNFFAGSSAYYSQLAYWYTNGSTFFTKERLANYTEYFGDPTLRIKQVAPPTNVTVTVSGSDNMITWTNASDNHITGYHVYRAPSSDYNSFTRLTSSPTTSPYTNSGAAGGAYVYLVRTIKLEQSDQRSYYNASQGSFGQASVADTTMRTKTGLRRIRGL